MRYSPEHIPFRRRDEALRFVEMLGDGRVVLHVRHGLVVTTLESFRDGLAQPFRRSARVAADTQTAHRGTRVRLRLDIPRSDESSGDLFAVAPGGVFVVGRVMAQAAVKDADEPVREGA